MRYIGVLAALAITGVFGGICEEECECQMITKRKCKFSIDCQYEYWCNQGICEPMKDIGERCRSSDECKGLSNCVPLGNGKCEETCRVDNDCLQYENGKNKYCTVRGFAGIQKGKCEMKHGRGCHCARSPECLGRMYCRNGQCQDTEEMVLCSLSCHGPVPGRPDRIRPGSVVNVTYSCTFIRRTDMGQLELRAYIYLDRRRLGKVSGLSPQYFNGFVTKVAKKGEFTVNLSAEMRTCVSNRDSCQANTTCYLRAGQ